MKKIFITTLAACLLLTIGDLSAQITTPALSPSAKAHQTIGMTDVMLEYSRPAMRGRTIFGDLVPYDAVWRTGANSATKISFSEDVTIEGKELAKGDYALFTKPGMQTWEVHFFPYTTSSAGGYGDATATVIANVSPMRSPKKLESFEIRFVDLKNESATMTIAWESLVVPVKIGVSSHKTAMKSIEAQLAGPTNGDYFSAGMYMARNGEDMTKALTYIRKATESSDPKFWQVKQEAELLADNGKYAEAIKKAKHSLELATKAENKNYMRMNTENIAKWSKM